MTPPAEPARGPATVPPGCRTGAGRAPDDGLTLLEMLIVLAVIAVATGMTTMSFGPHRDDATAAEARVLAAAISRAADRSLTTGTRAVLVVEADGYALAGARHALPAGTTLDGASLGVPLVADGRPFVVALRHGSDRWRIAFDGIRATATRAEDGA